MFQLRKIHAALGALLLSCSAHSGSPDRETSSAGGSGGATGGDCSPATGCASCTGCLARCLCLTGDTVSCPAACGETGSGGSGPPPPPPDAGGGAGGSGATGGTGGTGGSGTTQCTYPPGPYGTQVGATVAPTLSWEGFPEGQSQPSQISIQAYFDCDGTRGIHALLLTQSASWCGACKEHASQLNGLIAGGWGQQGIRALVLVIENASGAPASLATAQSWKTAFQPQGWAVGADPAFSFASGGGTGLPLLLVIDPRTMKIVERREGLYSDHATLEQLAAQNG